VNLDVDAGSAKVGFYCTSAHSAARVVLKAGDQALIDEIVAINPRSLTSSRSPCRRHRRTRLSGPLWEGARELISYVRPLTFEAAPPVVTPPPPPQEVKTNEELYLIGLRARQFHDPNVDPLLYWREALRRDPGDTRVNAVLGIVAFGQARYADAEKYLRKALERLTDRYTTPEDATAVYYLGATLKAAGNPDGAYPWFYKATWSQAWKAAGYYSLAQIAVSRGTSPRRSISRVARSIRTHSTFGAESQSRDSAPSRPQPGGPGRARLRLSRGRPAGCASHGRDLPGLRSEEAAQRLVSTMNAHPATAQETAAEYFDEGLWQDGADVLFESIAAAADKSRIHPMTYYYWVTLPEAGALPKSHGVYRRPRRCRRTMSSRSRTSHRRASAGHPG